MTQEKTQVVGEIGLAGAGRAFSNSAYSDAARDALTNRLLRVFFPKNALPTFTVELQGSLMKVSAKGGAAGRVVGGGTRGRVVGFSRQARKRMIDFCARVAWPSRVAFWSLTVHYPLGGDAWRVKVDLWKKRAVKLLRWFVWRIENQKRGVPHLHVISSACSKRVRRRLTRYWHKVFGQVKDKAALAWGVKVQELSDAQGVAIYVSKYAAKVTDESFAEYRAGRCWGRRGAVPLARRSVVALTAGEYFAVRDSIRAQVAARRGVSRETCKANTLYVKRGGGGGGGGV